jgi:hypothetical protein
MSTESHKMEQGVDQDQAPRHADVSYEPRDVKVASIYRYLAALGLTTVVALIICVFVLRFTTRFVASNDAPPPESREALGKAFRTLPPEPRLQGVPGHVSDPQQDLRNKIRTDTEANERLAWIDKQAGIAQIPVKDAMKIIAEKGSIPMVASPVEKRK